MPPAAATSNDEKKKRSSKVSFSDEVISKDKIGDGSKVLVEEEHGVFLSLLGQKRVVAMNDDGTGSLPERVATISFGGVDDADNDDLLKQKLAYSEKRDGNVVMQSGKHTSAETNRGGTKDGAEYENLVVKIGLLKIGHRYRMILPIPSNHWEEQDEKHTYNDEVKIIEDSFDDDLRGEIETEHSNNASHHHNLNITLSAKRRGPYRGRFVLELSRYPLDTANNSTPHKCIMSVQVDATIMGKDMGTPKLRNGVMCLGKIVGYDSDDETEWQGFD